MKTAVLEMRGGIVTPAGSVPRGMKIVLYDFDILTDDGDDVEMRGGKPCMKHVFVSAEEKEVKPGTATVV